MSLCPLRYIWHVGSPDNKETHNSLFSPQWRENKLGPHQAWFAMPYFTIIPPTKASVWTEDHPHLTKAFKNKRSAHVESSNRQINYQINNSTTPSRKRCSRLSTAQKSVNSCVDLGRISVILAQPKARTIRNNSRKQTRPFSGSQSFKLSHHMQQIVQAMRFHIVTTFCGGEFPHCSNPWGGSWLTCSISTEACPQSNI